MKQNILVIFILSLTVNLFGQKIEPNFIDNFKTSKWKSTDSFNDLTILKLDELKLLRWNYSEDTLINKPVLWIFKDKFKIKYYENIVQIKDSISTSTHRSFNTINYKFTFDDKKRILTLYIDENSKTKLIYEASIISTGNFILLTRKKQKNKNSR